MRNTPELKEFLKRRKALQQMHDNVPTTETPQRWEAAVKKLNALMKK